MGELIGQRVLASLYSVLEKHYDVTRDELPYRLHTAYKLLREVFGIHATPTISKNIVRRLYRKLNLKFEDLAGLELTEGVEIAKKKLSQSQTAARHTKGKRTVPRNVPRNWIGKRASRKLDRTKHNALMILSHVAFSISEQS